MLNGVEWSVVSLNIQDLTPSAPISIVVCQVIADDGEAEQRDENQGQRGEIPPEAGEDARIFQVAEHRTP